MPGDPEVHDQHEDREEQAAPADEQTTVAWRGLGRRGLLALVAVIVLLTAAVVVEAVVLWRDDDIDVAVVQDPTAGNDTITVEKNSFYGHKTE